MKNTIKIHFIFAGILSLFLITSCGKDDVAIPCSDEHYSVDGNKTNRKLLIIGIDGFRSDVLQDSIAPFMYALSSDPTAFFNGLHKTEAITSSGPNWSSILTGVHTTKHNVTNNNFTENRLEEFPHFFRYTEQVAPEKNTVSLCHWLLITGSISKGHADYNPLEVFSDQDIFDRGNAIVNGTDSIKGDYIFLHFDDLDHVGHGYGYSRDIPEYRQAVSTMDQYVEGLVNSVDARRAMDEDWMIFIVSDHGGEGTDHSGQPNHPKVNQTIFFAQHPSIPFTDVIVSSQVDLVPTAMEFLGISNSAFSCNVDGKSIIK